MDGVVNMCLYPKLMLNKKYQANKKNGGNIPPLVDKRAMFVAVGCGRCIECMKQNARHWQIRLYEEIKNEKDWHFITLTFDEQSYDKLKDEIDWDDGYRSQNEIATLAVRRWLERVRKMTGKSIRHWIVTELGNENTERIHMHGLVKSKIIDKVMDRWTYGRTDVGYKVDNQTINYITKYISKMDEKHKDYKAKILTSAGIGRKFLDTGRADIARKKDQYRNEQGYKMGLPLYYRNKLFDDEEREKLWMEMLDKEVRYVRGEKVDISQGEEEYYKLREYHRRVNEQLGYGNDEKSDDEQLYRKRREQLRKIKLLNELKRKQENLENKKQ